MQNRTLAVLTLLTLILLSCENNTQTSTWFTSLPAGFYERVSVDVFSNSILVPVVVGEKTRYFQLDTGAPTSISPQLFEELELQVHDSIEGTDYHNNKRQVYRTFIKELKIGKSHFKDVKASVIDPIQNFKSCGQTIDGYLGSDFFAEAALRIDIRNKEVIFANSADKLQLDGHNASDMNILFEQKTPFVRIYFPGVDRAEDLIFDTGSTNYLYRLRKSVFYEMFKGKHLQRRNVLDTLDKNFNGSGVFGMQKDSMNFRVVFDSLRISGIDLLNGKATTFDAPRHSILGAPLLRLGIVSIDFVNKKFYLKPYGEEPLDLKPIHGISIDFNYEQAQMKVTSVDKGSIGEMKKVEVGFILKKLNSISTDSLGLCDYFEIDWDLERRRKEVYYTFLTKNGEVPVKIEN